MKKNVSLAVLIITLLILIWSCGFIRNEIVNQAWLMHDYDGTMTTHWFDICYGFSFIILFAVVVLGIVKNIFDI